MIGSHYIIEIFTKMYLVKKTSHIYIPCFYSVYLHGSKSFKMICNRDSVFWNERLFLSYSYIVYIFCWYFNDFKWKCCKRNHYADLNGVSYTFSTLFLDAPYTWPHFVYDHSSATLPNHSGSHGLYQSVDLIFSLV